MVTLKTNTSFTTIFKRKNNGKNSYLERTWKITDMSVQKITHKNGYVQTQE